LYVEHSFFPWLCVILLHFSHDRSNWSSPSFSITFENLPGVSILLPKGTKSFKQICPTYGPKEDAKLFKSTQKVFVLNSKAERSSGFFVVVNLLCAVCWRKLSWAYFI
jgi:hypothetical protein